MSARPNDIVDPIVQSQRALAKDSPDLKDAAALSEAILQ
jgi:hypothetical protein